MSKTPAQRIKKHGSRADVPDTAPPPVINPLRQRAAARQSAPQSGQPQPGQPSAQQPQSSAKMLVIAAVVAALFMFWYLHLMALSQMTQLSGGLTMPDSRVFGFDAAAIDQLRAAMNDAARGQLNWVHKTAGMLFPLLFGLAWALVIGVNTTRSWFRTILWSLTGLFVVVRVVGNFAIDGLFATAAPSDGAVAWASILVVAGWVLFVLCLVSAVLVLLPRRKKAQA
ncbi:hypothetical protein QFZ52_000473 [Arthrobacter woluwensis]|uniref:hypothetical protein n=1 Tax=Arthrobacter woluwensis TaxID=156980 RepID=UPI0027845A20|nr:hypothetical protein [Arthrobacter woluwensis]MDQ0707821.1 hypothetical protein [Arthrobacter woluwensis]